MVLSYLYCTSVMNIEPFRYLSNNNNGCHKKIIVKNRNYTLIHI